MRHSCSGKVGRTGLQRVRHFQGKCLRTPIPVSFHTPKITKIIHRGICSSCLTVIYQDACLVASAPAPKSHTCWSPPLPFHFLKLFFFFLKYNWLDCKEIQPVHPKGGQSWIFTGGTDAEAETPILWPPDAKNWLIWKDPDAGKDWRREEKRTTEDEMVGCITDSMDMSLGKLGSWWRTGRPGVLQSTGLQRVRHDWVTELNWTELIMCSGWDFLYLLYFNLYEAFYIRRS